MTRRVVITGMGTINPCGHTVAETWDAITHGRSGVGPITGFDPSNFLVKIAAEVKGFDPAKYMDVKEARRMDRFEQIAMAASQEALRQSGLEIRDDNADRIGVIVSSAIGGCKAFQDGVRTLDASGPRRVDVFFIPKLMSNGAGGLISIATGARGPNMSVASACASGSDGIGQAWLMLKSGMIDAAITGASETSLIEIGIAAFDRTSAMTHRTEAVPQPFDRERDGLVMGEGAAILVIETEEHARARGATIVAELAGYAATADAYHITAPSDSGAPGAQAMRLAVASAGANLDEVGYINAHGTGTVLNDAGETRAIKRAFGERAHAIPVSSTKSMTGHIMGMTGALEAIFCVEAIRTGLLPPTINYRTPDPECNLDYVPNTARQARIDLAISNAFGFGGHNSVLAIRRYTG
jgi:beta-ketoacyl-acyl-carrier-protein synthase II